MKNKGEKENEIKRLYANSSHGSVILLVIHMLIPRGQFLN